MLDHIKLSCSLLGDDLVCDFLQFGIKLLKEIFKQQRQELKRSKKMQMFFVCFFKSQVSWHAVSVHMHLLPDVIARCASSQVSQVPVVLCPVYRRQLLLQPPPNLCISIHPNKQAALLEINKEIKLPLRSQAN